MGRAIATVLGGLLLLGLFAVGAVMLDNRATEFEARGTHVPGVVTRVYGGFRQSWTAEVRYRAHGVERVGSINVDSTPDFKVGDPITVIYDPADPERIAAPGFPNDLAVAIVAMALIALAGLSTFIVGLVHLARAVFTREGRQVRRSSRPTGRPRFSRHPYGRHARKPHHSD